MNDIRAALISAGIVTPKALQTVKLKRKMVFKPMRKSRYESKDIVSEMKASQRNPSVSGSMHHDARLMDGAGSDISKAYKLSGPSTPFGMKYNSTSKQVIDPKDK